MLEYLIFSDHLRYEQHVLIQDAPDNGEPFRIQGVFGAALLTAMLVATDEGKQRGIVMDTIPDRRAWMKTYEREVLREGWGTLTEEINLLSDAYIQLAVEGKAPDALCRNQRLLDIAGTLMVEYMQQLVFEAFGKHIWECVPWRAPFADWLMAASYAETQRQRYLQMDWTDPVKVTFLAENRNETDAPTLRFENEAAKDIMARYYRWLKVTFKAQQLELPGAKPESDRSKRFILEQESDWDYLAEEVAAWDAETQALWRSWMDGWQDYIARQLKPQREVRFWTASLSDDMKERLTDYLRMQERQPMHYKCLSAAVYALRQLGYIRRWLTKKDMLRWLTDHLSYDYIAKNNAYQFSRAWYEHGRFAPAVRDEVKRLAELGIHSITKSDNDITDNPPSPEQIG